MSVNRIQKLLFSEYCDFEDMVLVESPFAQTTREGQGIRQVHLGLTPTKLILATDVLPFANTSSVMYLPGIDPDVETFELVAVYPIECVSLSIFHRRKRQSLKARFSNNKVLYFELGGFEKRNMFWNLWCERLKFLSPEDPGSSYSETSVATSTTNSTLYISSSRQVVGKKGVLQFWVEYGAGDATNTRSIAKWTDKNLFIGKNDGIIYTPIMNRPLTSDFIQSERKRNYCQHTEDSSRTSDDSLLTRLDSHVNKTQNGQLFLPAENYIMSRKFSESTTQSADMFTLYSSTIPKAPMSSKKDFSEVAENCVRLWEYYKDATLSCMTRCKHKRRYALSPQPHFLNGLGPWNISTGERYSVQVKRTVSLVCIRRQPAEPELRLPVSKRQLVASISCEDVNSFDKFNANSNSIKTAHKSPVIFFWTPEYWYRPRTAKSAYKELQSHLHKIREYRETTDMKKRGYKKKLLRKRKRNDREHLISDSDDDDTVENFKGNHRIGHSKSFFRVFANKTEDDLNKDLKTEKASLQYLRRMLRLDIALSAWDFDSTTLAYQLTLIDRDLFLKIPPIELGVLMWQQSSKNAPNFGALIAFSHRISCIVSTEILRDDSEKIRARLVARFISTAEKCNRISNFQSCKSVLNGLQSPPIYRLHSTWNYLRKKHATNYMIFENLCKLYRDPRLLSYQKAFKRASQSVPFIPFIGDFLLKMLDKIPDYEKLALQVSKPDSCSRFIKKTSTEKDLQSLKNDKNMSFLKKILFSLKKQSTEIQVEKAKSEYEENKENDISESKLNSLVDYYSQSSFFEDNRVERLKEAVELLEKFQIAAAHYIIPKNELAKEFLLKARYREERDNFIQSLKMEPNYDDSNSSYYK